MIAATADLLERHGFRATGLNKILSESGAPRGSLYFHFPGGKQQLAAAALREAGAGIERALRAQAAPGERTLDGLVRVIQFLEARMIDAEFDKGCPVVMVALEAAASSDDLHAACTEVYRGWQEAIAQRLREDGRARDDAEAVACVVLAALEGALVLCRAHRDTTPLRALTRVLPRLLGD